MSDLGDAAGQPLRGAASSGGPARRPVHPRARTYPPAARPGHAWAQPVRKRRSHGLTVGLPGLVLVLGDCGSLAVLAFNAVGGALGPATDAGEALTGHSIDGVRVQNSGGQASGEVIVRFMTGGRPRRADRRPARPGRRGPAALLLTSGPARGPRRPDVREGESNPHARRHQILRTSQRSRESCCWPGDSALELQIRRSSTISQRAPDLP
jgi:hypothetical protein